MDDKNKRPPRDRTARAQTSDTIILPSVGFVNSPSPTPTPTPESDEFDDVAAAIQHLARLRLGEKLRRRAGR